ncbi:FimV/HubP family polar landmark protein [Marinicella rhabdoformis]|uniref:FimV/HubP family polar landmark protein n=1 Tax=Marinicella rhabdoformis TaxID=2580566 RepID=UPI0012AEC80D|nr:FimV/HubP family polar landmark protein [Marinicella rhabdoformis]
MKQKSILLGLVMGLTLASQDTQSLGMGTIQVHSALDQPLHASINLMIGDDEDLSGLDVKLASAEDYKKVGLDRSFVPGNISVSIDEENPLLIKVSSSGPVSEPIVSLLLDVNWGNGRIFREFTILLDPPVYSSSQIITETPVAQETTNQESEIIEEVADAVDETPQVQTRVEASEGNQFDVEENAVEDTVENVTDEEPEEAVSYDTTVGSIEVMSGDTLWRLANQNKPSALTTNQMMAALFNSNPQAFANNNINQLIKGSRLMIPDANELQSISQTDALDLVRSHNDTWAPSQVAEESYSSFQTTEPDYSEPEEAVAETIDYGVELAGSTDQEDSNGGLEGESYENLNESATAEELYNKDSENAELKERLSELEGIVEVQQAALEIKSDDLANLEDQFTDSDETVTEEATSSESDDVWGDDPSVALTEEEMAAEPESMITDLSVGEESETDSEESTAVEAEPVKTEVKALSIPQNKEESMVDKGVNWIMENLQWLALGLLALLVLIFVPKFLRSKNKDVAEETSFLDDIKSRNNGKESEIEDLSTETEDTKVNEPLIETEPVEDMADDVLADLDKKIDFESDEENEDEDEDIFKGFDDEPEAITEPEQVDEESDSDVDDGFDLDGFLNDDSDDELDSEIEGAVDDVVEDTEEVLEESFDVDEDFDFDLSELDDLEESNDATDGDLSDEIDDALDSLSGDGEEAVEAVEQAVEEEPDFSLDEDFEFDLDDELEEIAEEAEEVVSEAADASEDAFDEVLDISDDSTESLEVTTEADDSEIDLGLDLDDMLEDGDVIDTKIDLAKAYLEMGDKDGAKNLLKEVAAEGDESQIEMAKKLLDDM